MNFDRELFEASKYGDIENFKRLVRLLIEEKGIDVLKSIFLLHGIHFILSERSCCLEHLISLGLNFQELNIHSQPILILSVIFNNLEIVKFLCLNGENPNLEIREGENCLSLSIDTGRGFEIFRTLLKFGANHSFLVYSENEESKVTLFHYILSKYKFGGFPDATEYIVELLKYGADPEQSDNLGRKPIDILEGEKDKSVFSDLIQRYYNPEMKEPDCC